MTNFSRLSWTPECKSHQVRTGLVKKSAKELITAVIMLLHNQITYNVYHSLWFGGIWPSMFSLWVAQYSSIAYLILTIIIHRQQKRPFLRMTFHFVTVSSGLQAVLYRSISVFGSFSYPGSLWTKLGLKIAQTPRLIKSRRPRITMINVSGWSCSSAGTEIFSSRQVSSLPRFPSRSRSYFSGRFKRQHHMFIIHLGWR